MKVDKISNEYFAPIDRMFHGEQSYREDTTFWIALGALFVLAVII